MHDKHLENALKSILADLGIHTFECRKQPKGYATITVLNKQQGLALLEKYHKRGQTVKPEQTLTTLSTAISIEEGKYAPDTYLLHNLEEEERNRRAFLTNSSVKTHEPHNTHRSFPIVSLSCGTFDYREDSPVFEDHFSMEPIIGGIKFERTRLKITIQKPMASLCLII